MMSSKDDAVSHESLRSKLKCYGNKEVALKLLKSYLSEHKHFIQFGLVKSTLQTIKCGVPQGIILELLMFLLNRHDIVKSSERIDFHVFADDIAIFYSYENNKQ